MSNKVSVLSGRADHTRVVPIKHPPEVLQVPKGLPGAAAAQLVYNDGPLLDAVEVFTIFWGQDWNKDPQTTLSNDIGGFFKYILTSSLLDQMSEYSVASQGYNIGKGKYLGTLTVTTPNPATTITDGEIQHFLKDYLSTRKDIPKPDQNKLYFIYLPPGVTVSAFGDRSCLGFCGYHENISGTQIYYAVMPYPGCNGCLGGLNTLDALTSTSSHELIEAITDPVPGQGWYDNANGEIGDICAWQTRRLDKYMIQLEWSNSSNSCK